MKSSIDGLTLLIQSRLEKMYTATPGQILAMDHKKCTCTCALSIPVKSSVTGVQEEMTELQDVPIVAPLGAKYGVTFPISAGDKVLIHFMQSELGEWKNTVKPLTTINGVRRFHVSNAVINLGLYPPVEMKTIYPAGMDPNNICINGDVKISTSLDVGGVGSSSVAIASSVESLVRSVVNTLANLPVTPATAPIKAAFGLFTIPSVGSSTLKAK